MLESLVSMRKNLNKQIRSFERKGISAESLRRQVSNIEGEMKNYLDKLNIGIRSIKSPNFAKIVKLEKLSHLAGWSAEHLEDVLITNKLSNITFVQSFENTRMEIILTALNMNNTSFSAKQLAAITANVNSGQFDKFLKPIWEEYGSDKITVNDVLNLTPKFLAVWGMLNVEVEGDDYFAS